MIKLEMSFFKPQSIPINKKRLSNKKNRLCLSYKRQSYCWQVALQQSLLPLKIDEVKLVL